ncbi:MAG: MarR family transcriptional regulator [Pseudomonadota bacterium]
MSDRSQDALIALRQIQRRVEQASKKLAQKARLTPSQLHVLQILSERGETAVGEISTLTQLKQATITSLSDKLVACGYIERRKCDQDRRRVWISLLPAGEQAIKAAPDLLQDVFAARFSDLPGWQQAMIVASLERVSAILDAGEMDAAPILDVGDLDAPPE